MPFYFDPDGATTLDGDEFFVSVFDDPFATNGDRTDWVVQSGTFVQGAARPGIVTMCAGNQPTPIAYEWKIPLSVLKITPGAAHTYRAAIVHNHAAWPSTLTQTLQGAYMFATDPSTWGTFTSSKDWQ
jgi:hypothetical protein